MTEKQFTEDDTFRVLKRATYEQACDAYSTSILYAKTMATWDDLAALADPFLKPLGWTLLQLYQYKDPLDAGN